MKILFYDINDTVSQLISELLIIPDVSIFFAFNSLELSSILNYVKPQHIFICSLPNSKICSSYLQNNPETKVTNLFGKINVPEIIRIIENEKKEYVL
ncbi:MAG: hypothetical protein K9N09_05235 [Candidatus Cloacimonetes bacterium]|nr:hypothetical protein [Candidatus Cloacimonadota bacterium]MCF7883509.1 hypothetical protein [Candidatus Cloacimonadota bacterium]